MRRSIKLLAPVALTKSLPKHRLRAGEVGTVVEGLAAGVFEVEFSDNRGRTYAPVPVPAEDLLPLYNRPGRAA